ncbi:MAG: hypothetical protein IKL22_08750 [Lachnospiraceae bacterium]|nr:hypothetical protein [Lachnospiraceae bacterium]
MGMRKEKISEVLGYMDDKLVEEAGDFAGLEKTKKQKKWHSLFIPGLCACAVLIAAILWLPGLLGIGSRQVDIGGITREYKKMSVSSGETAIIWPWEYQTITEQYGTLTMEGTEYRIRGMGISEELLGGELGSYPARGYDHYTEQEYTKEFEVRTIRGIADEQLVAVNMEGEFYVFARDGYVPPVTFGELLEIYHLQDNLPLLNFTLYEGNDSKGYFTLEEDSEIWKVLSECTDAPFIEDDGFNRMDRNHLSFTATSDALGVYKRVVYITEDGYFVTNVFDYSYKYYIGEEAATRIMDYAATHAIKGLQEAYAQNLAGSIEEITEEYLLINDGVLCKNPEDGMVFRLSMEDIRVRRFVEVITPKVGDAVSVQFMGTVNIEKGNLIDRIYDISRAHISDGDVWVEE